MVRDIFCRQFFFGQIEHQSDQTDEITSSPNEVKTRVDYCHLSTAPNSQFPHRNMQTLVFNPLASHHSQGKLIFLQKVLQDATKSLQLATSTACTDK